MESARLSNLIRNRKPASPYVLLVLIHLKFFDMKDFHFVSRNAEPEKTYSDDFISSTFLIDFNDSNGVTC